MRTLTELFVRNALKRSGFRLWACACTAVLSLLFVPASAAEPALIPNSAVTSSLIGQTVAVQGRITNIIPPSSERAPYSLYITDDTRALRIVIFRDVYAQIKNPEKLAVGARVKVIGTVKEYRNNLEIQLNSGDQISLYDGPAAPAVQAASERDQSLAPSTGASEAVLPAGPVTLTPIKSITVEMERSPVVIRGRVTNVRPSTRPNVPTIVTVQDDTGSISVVYWDDVGSLIPAAHKPAPGVTVQVSGKVNPYQGKPQVKLYNAGDIHVVSADSPGASAAAVPAQASPATTASPPADVQFTKISRIDRSMLDKPVAVQGRITRVIAVNGGKLVEITDDSGKIMVPCWENEVGGSPYFAALRTGASIAVKGKVSLYEKRNEVQIRLDDAGGLLYVK
ncbi:MAG: hypothetical protein Kow0059_02630 [Candidatus Sumerlaeia bacterium]